MLEKGEVYVLHVNCESQLSASGCLQVSGLGHLLWKHLVDFYCILSLLTRLDLEKRKE